MTEYEKRLDEIGRIGLRRARGNQTIAIAITVLADDHRIKDIARRSIMYDNAIAMGLSTTQVLTAGHPTNTSDPFLLVDLLSEDNS